jgi:hypothetical protein
MEELDFLIVQAKLVRVPLLVVLENIKMKGVLG